MAATDNLSGKPSFNERCDSLVRSYAGIFALLRNNKITPTRARRLRHALDVKGTALNAELAALRWALRASWCRKA
jgi:hypothetical protein